MKDTSHINLKSLRVLVTRPSPLGEILCESVNHHQGKSIYFPTIEITSLAQTDVFIKQVKYLSTFDWLIFISPLTVYTAAQQINHYWPNFPVNLNVAAIGGGTAQALRSVGLPVHLYPEDKWSSEGLLELPAFEEVENKRICVVSGDEGRDWLIETLKLRGAFVSRLVAFQRCYPIVDVSNYLNMLRNDEIDVITISSGDGLKNLVELLEEEIIKLLSTPLLVISERLAHLAKELGFEKIILAKSAANNAVLEALYHFKEGHKDGKLN